MLKLEKIDAKDFYAVALVFLLAFGVWQFVPKSTLPEFEVAGMLRDSLSGKAVPAYVSVAAALESAYAGFFGLAPSSAQAITGFLLIFPSLLLGICAFALYLALRTMEFRRAESAFIAMLFSVSLCCLAFLPGIYSAASLACVAFFIFLAAMAHYSKKGAIASLAIAAISAAAAGYFDASFAIAAVATSAFFAHQAKKRDAAALAPFAACAIVAIAATLAAGNLASLAFSADRLSLSFSPALPFMIGAAAVPFALYFAGACTIEWMLLSAAGVLLCAFSPLAGAALLALPAAKGASLSLSDISKKARLAASFAAAFFAIFAIASQFFALPQGLLASLLLACLAPITMHLYEYQNKAFFSVLYVIFLSSALFFACIYQLPPQKPLYPSYLGEDMAGALTYLSGAAPQKVAALSNEDAVKFYLPSSQLEGTAAAQDYLLKGSPRLESGEYLVLSPSSLAALSGRGDFELYSYATAFEAGGRQFAIFTNRESRLVARELGADGSFALKDGSYIDGYGRAYATIPLSRMFTMANSSHNETSNWLIVLSEGAVPPHFLEIYSGSGGATLVNGSGEVSVFRVN